MSACAQMAPTAAEAPGGERSTLPNDAIIAAPRPPIDTPRSQLMYHLMAGELAEGRGRPDVAAQAFRAALEIQPSAELAARATALSLAANDLDGAVEAAEIWKRTEPEDLGANDVLVRLYLRQGREQDVLAMARPLIEHHPGGLAEGYRAVALVMGQDNGGHSSMALRLVETLAGEHPEEAGAWYAVGLIAVRFNELGVAEDAARKAIALQPGQAEATLLLAGVQVRQGEPDEADRTLESALAENPGAADLRVGYAKLLLESGRVERAYEHLQRALKQAPENADALYAAALIELERRELDAAEGYLQRLIDNGQRRDEAAYYLGRIAEVREQPEQALAWYDQVESGAQALDAVLRGAAVEAGLGNMDEARSRLEWLRRRYPQLSIRLYGAEGEILYAAEQYEDALALYNRALGEFPDNADLLYGRSLVREQLGAIPAAESDLRAIIDADPEDARALNALGYMLTVHSQRYREALDLIERAATLAPDDAAVIDSLGWIHYRLGDLQQAHRFLQRAFDRLQDPEIAAHLGEVLWQMGRKDEARQVWETALREDPDHPVLRETVGRLAR